MVKISKLQKSYGRFKVLDGLCMNVEKGDVYGFLGKNGCGKTTTMSILTNIIPKDGGDIFLGENGEKIRVGYLPETPALYGYMNGYEYLGYIAACCNYQGDKNARINEVLELVGMSEGGRRRIKGYSRGMNQRLGIAAAIFNDPQLLILDEPTSALDPGGRAEVMNIIQRLSQTGCTIILCTHILSDVERLANKIGILVNGRIVLEGKIDDIMRAYGRNEVEIRLFEPNEENVAAVRTLEEKEAVDKVDFYEKTGAIVIRTRDARAAIREAIALFAEKGIEVQRCEIVSDSLENIYLNVVNAQGNGGRA